jgi:hypothetical protein
LMLSSVESPSFSRNNNISLGKMSEALCCCEYVNSAGDKSHILACCCNCEALDSACDKYLSCFLVYNLFNSTVLQMHLMQRPPDKRTHPSHYRYRRSLPVAMVLWSRGDACPLRRGTSHSPCAFPSLIRHTQPLVHCVRPWWHPHHPAALPLPLETSSRQTPLETLLCLGTLLLHLYVTHF